MQHMSYQRVKDKKKKSSKISDLEVEKTVQKLGRDLVESKLTSMLQKTTAELEAIEKSRTAQSLDIFISKIILQGIKSGDQYKLNFIFDRLIGKVTDVKEIRLPKPTVIQRLDGSTVELGSRIEDKDSTIVIDAESKEEAKPPI